MVTDIILSGILNLILGGEKKNSTLHSNENKNKLNKNYNQYFGGLKFINRSLINR